MRYEESTFKPLVEGTKGLYLNINQEFSSLLNRDFTNHVVKTVQEGRVYRIVTEKYDFLTEAHVVLKPKPIGSTKAVYHTSALSNKVSELPKTGEKASSNLSVLGVALIAVASGLTVGVKKKD